MAKSTIKGNKAKLVGKVASGLSLTAKLEKVANAAPPAPKDALHAWLRKAYRLRRNLVDGERTTLRTLANNKGITTGDRVLRAIVHETAGKHVSKKMKLKYVTVLEKALAEKIQSKNLRQYIEGHGGINKLAAGG